MLEPAEVWLLRRSHSPSQRVRGPTEGALQSSATSRGADAQLSPGACWPAVLLALPLRHSEVSSGESCASLRQSTHLVNTSEELSLWKAEKGLSHPSH